MKTWQLELGRHRVPTSSAPREHREGDIVAEAKANGIAWADREAVDVVVIGAWPYTWLEALPIIRPCREVKTRRNLASIANEAAARRWGELARGAISLAFAA